MVESEIRVRIGVGDKVVFLSPYELPLPYRKSERVYSVGVVLRSVQCSGGTVIFIIDHVGRKHVCASDKVHVVLAHGDSEVFSL